MGKAAIRAERVAQPLEEKPVIDWDTIQEDIEKTKIIDDMYSSHNISHLRPDDITLRDIASKHSISIPTATTIMGNYVRLHPEYEMIKVNNGSALCWVMRKKD